MMLQQLGTHHWCERQRDKTRHQDSGGNGQGKLAEQFAGVAGDERQRREYRRQGDGHRDHGKRNFLTADQRRLAGRHARFDVTINVFQHNNGIVHHQANGEHNAK